MTKRANRFHDEEEQAIVHGNVKEGKEWRRELQAMSSPETLEDAMELVRQQSDVSKKLSKGDYDVVIENLEEKDRVSLSQWMVDEGIDVVDPDKPKTPEEEVKEDVLQELGREPLEREGVTPRTRERRRILGDWMDHFKKKGDIWDGVTLVELEKTVEEGWTEYWYTFLVDEYPNYSVYFNPNKGWYVIEQFEQEGATESRVVGKNSVTFDRDQVDKALLMDILEAGGAKKETKEALDEFDKMEAKNILEVYFNHTEEQAQEVVADPGNAAQLRSLIEQYSAYKTVPEFSEKPARLSRRIIVKN